MPKVLLPITAALAMALAAFVPQGMAALADPGASGAMAAAPARGMTRTQAAARAAWLFDRLDLNHDGRLDAADRELHRARLFDRLDTNHDGSISRAEFNAAHARAMDMDDDDARGDAMSADAPMDHHHGPGARHHAMMMAGLILHVADPQHSGSVSRDAFVAAALTLFDRADSDHDGVLTPAEHHAAQAALRTNPSAGMPPAEGARGW